jgi:hypothetical protein
MKSTSITKWLLAVPALTLGFATPAMAHKVVHVQGTLYVIICEPDGGAFTFNGTSTGAGEIGGLLCPTAMVGGGTDPNASWQTIEARPAQQALAIKTKGTSAQRTGAPTGGTAAHEAAHTVQQGAGK